LSSRLKLYLARTWALIFNSLGAIGRHHGGQLAASMSYYALLSVFPAAIVAAAVAGFVLDDPAAREDAVEFLFKELPLSETDGRGDLETLIDGVIRNSGALGVIGVVALLITSSALISAARNSIAVIFEDDLTRGFLRGKGVDLILILIIGALFALSFAATVLTQFEPNFGGDVLGLVESALTATGSLLPIALSAAIFAILYRALPVHRPPLRDVWPGVVFATIGYEVVKRGFSLYLESFADYSAVYGSLGAVVAFMVFVYVASFAFLFGAEIAALWPEVRAGKHDPGGDDGEGKTFGEEVRGFLKGLVSRNPTEEHPAEH